MMGGQRKCLQIPFRQRWRTSRGHGSSPEYCQPLQQDGNLDTHKPPFMFFIVKAVLFMRPALQITPRKQLHFLYEPGKQVSSPIKVKNTSRSFIAFKLQTNAPKSCFIRSSQCILAPGETVLISVVKFIELPEHKRVKINEKFKIVSLKVKPGLQYSPELFEEQKESVVVEENFKVIYLDPHKISPETEKLKKCLAEAEAAQQACKRTV